MIVYHENQSVLLHPSGRLDLEEGIALRRQLAEITCRQHSLWIVDLTQVDFIDSSGLIALIAGLNLADENRCRLVLRNLHPSVKLVLEITQLDQVFEIVSSTKSEGTFGAANAPLSTATQHAA